MTAALVSQSQYLCLAVHMSRSRLFYPNWLLLSIWVINLLTIAHVSYSLFFTGYKYHSWVESVLGIFFGYVLVAVNFYVDIFSDCLHEILSTISNKLCKRKESE